MERIGYPLSEDQRDTRRNDNSSLLRINDDQLKFELPDNAAGNAEMQRGTDMDHRHPYQSPPIYPQRDGRLVMSLQRFQLDVAARLESAAFFADVPVFIFRPRAALTAAQIQDNINAALGALTTQNGKAGLCATVLMPLLHTEKQELPGPYLHLQCIIRVQENVMVNMGVNGTQIACEDAAIAVAQILHLWTPGGTAGILRAAPETITPNPAFEGKVTYDVLIESELDLPACRRQPSHLSAKPAENLHCLRGRGGHNLLHHRWFHALARQRDLSRHRNALYSAVLHARRRGR